MESIGQEKQSYAASLASIQEARKRISTFAHLTPVLSSSSLNQHAHTNLYFKCELFQKGGAFKFRGACNAVLSLPQDLARKGVITHSSGNHAAALALAARMQGIPAFVVMPNNAPQCKVENVKRYGGKIYFSEPTLKSREEVALNVQEQTGAALIHPYNDASVISGQGTVALELLDQIPELDVIIVPISGGGLISGVAIAAKAINPNIKIFAAEPKGADDAAQSKAAGELIITPHTHTIADGLRASLGSLTWPVVRDMVDEVVTVTEEEIVNAMQMCYEILKVVVEPSGAVGLAAVLSTQFQSSLCKQTFQHVGIVLSGGNVDLGVLGEYFEDFEELPMTV